jgi:hypothetical protein
MSESTLQTAVISHIKHKMNGLGIPHKIITNPFSEMQIAGTNAQKYSTLARMKSQGWKKSQPDILVLNSVRDFAIELKTPKTDPFRIMRNGKAWFDGTESKDWAHVAAQAAYLAELKTIGKVAMFASSLEEVDWIIKIALDPDFSIDLGILQFNYQYQHYCIDYFPKSKPKGAGKT